MQAKLWSISGLAVELARDRRSLASALEGLEPDETGKDGAGRMMRRYRMARVVEHLFGRSRGEALDGSYERARRDKETADKLALENALRRGELAEVSQVQSTWADHIAAARAKLLSMPTKLGPQLTHVADPNIIAGRIRAEVYAAINELAAWEPPASDDGVHQT